MLAKNAPADLAVAQSLRFVLSTLSYARRDVLPPLLHGRRPPLRLVRNRARSYAGYLKLLPGMVADRRALRRRAPVGDDELRARWVTRADFDAATAANVEAAGTRCLDAFVAARDGTAPGGGGSREPHEPIEEVGA
jgi:hypothetical protein